jgi:hypothetical protein
MLVPSLLLLNACSLDDSERCLDDYVWSDAQHACLLESDVDTDNLDTLGVTDSETNGVGAACSSHEDCAVHAADYCLASPDTPDRGMCTLFGCMPDDCGESFACCDCTHVDNDNFRTDLPFCVPNQNVRVMTTVVTCKCE